jgi:hypothetical protein
MGRGRLLIALCVVFVIAGGLLYRSALGTPRAPVQPIAYSHRIHAGERKIQCTFCHENGDGKTAHMLIPSAQKCAICHRGIKADSPEVQKVLKHADEGTEPAWKRVYGMPESAHVFFTHVPHLRAQISCQTCHGLIQEMDRVTRVVDQSMGWCISCHRQVSGQVPGMMQKIPGTDVAVNRLTECVVCHR